MRLRDAAQAARDFAREFVEEDLADEMLFCVRLNGSYDGNPLHPDERVYPEDSSADRARELRECTEEQTVGLLWRQGTVPEWVDLSVIGVNRSSTLVKVLSCGRFTANDDLLYHQGEGRPPFHVLGPALPVGYEEGQRFSIYHHAVCWSEADIERLRESAQKVWSLELAGNASKDRNVNHLPELPGMEILELRDSEVSGEGLHTLGRFLSLRVLRIYLSRPESFHVRGFPHLPDLTTLGIQNLGRTRWNVDSIVRACPKLASITLEAAGELTLDGEFHHAMDDLNITARGFSGDVRLPRRLKSLSLHLRNGRPSEIAHVLEGVEALGNLSLRGTPIDDAVLERIMARHRLKYLDVVETRVSEGMIHRLAAAHPKLRVHHPSLKAKRGSHIPPSDS